MNKFIEMLNKFADGDFVLTTKRKPVKIRREVEYENDSIKNRYQKFHDTKSQKIFDNIYRISSIIICFSLITILLITVSFLPRFGDPNAPVNNEVSERYLQDGLKETGAVNAVTGMILDYRAFDTFGESAVLFVACTMVLFLLQKDQSVKQEVDTYQNLPRDTILKTLAKIIIPFTFMFGIYLVLNGHLSPGGGFSGGAIMGAGLILYSSAFGYRNIKRVVTNKLIKGITFCSLGCYALLKGFSFYTGANHIPTGIPLGEPGAIISSGFILPLNICVGLIVTCTIYAFYSVFSKGEI